MPNHEVVPTMPDYSNVNVDELYAAPNQAPSEQTLTPELILTPDQQDIAPIEVSDQPVAEAVNQSRWSVRVANRIADIANRFGSYMEGKQTVGEVTTSLSNNAQEKITQGREIAAKVGAKVMDTARFSGFLLSEVANDVQETGRSYKEAAVQGKEQMKTYLIDKAATAETRKTERKYARQAKRQEIRESIVNKVETTKFVGRVLVGATTEGIRSVGDQISQKATEHKQTIKKGINGKRANHQQNISNSFQQRSINLAHEAAIREDKARTYTQAA